MRTAISLIVTGLVFASLNVNSSTATSKSNSQFSSFPEQLHSRAGSPRKPRKRTPYRGSGRREVIKSGVYKHYVL
ncbi:MAG: hypothetical protein AAF208_05595 [Cyanobacteria bacterium P01_A01_bin.45]